MRNQGGLFLYENRGVFQEFLRSFSVNFQEYKTNKLQIPKI